MKELRILVAARPALSRVIAHLLHDHPELRIVATLSDGDHLSHQAALFLPDVIVVNQRLLGRELPETLVDLKRSSPGSKLILIRADSVLTVRRDSDQADGLLEEEALVQGLVPVMRSLVERIEPGLAAD